MKGLKSLPRKHCLGSGEVGPIREKNQTGEVLPRITLAPPHRGALKRASCLRVVLIGVREKWLQFCIFPLLFRVFLEENVNSQAF